MELDDHILSMINMTGIETDMVRGGPFDTQGGGGLCKFSKKIIWLSLIKK